jgi:hypothetical protein
MIFPSEYIIGNLFLGITPYKARKDNILTNVPKIINYYIKIFY